MKKESYWNGNGKYQEMYEELYRRIVPKKGKCDTLNGEVLRAASMLYFRYYNDGDVITDGCVNPESSAVNAWGFLHSVIYSDIDNISDESAGKLSLINVLCRRLAHGRLCEEDYENELEKLVDNAIVFASMDKVDNRHDMLNEEYSNICVENVYFEDDDDDDDGEE